MTYIHSLVSDSYLDIDLLKDLKQRRIDQKHFFTHKKGADLYYEAAKISSPYYENNKNNLVEEDYSAFFRKNIINNKEKIAVISLECGNAKFEKAVFGNIGKKKNRLDYIGIDSSRYMLELAKRYLEDCGFEKEFICADFSSYNFRSEIGYIINQYKHKVFAFFGATVGSIMPSNISDVLVNLMKNGDLLWMNAYLRTGLGKEEDFKIFNRFVRYRNKSVVSEHFFYPLERLGVPFKNGRITLEMEEEKSIGSLRFIFSFEFTKKTIIKFRNEVITILPEEKIELFNMRAYDRKTFERFFIEHGFKLIDSQAKGNTGQFLFKKK